jgi:hypothetical protein
MSCHLCYLRDSREYRHENCCQGSQRHILTYVGRRRVLAWSPDQIWYPISVDSWCWPAVYTIGMQTHARADACATDIEIHSDIPKHLLLSLLSCYGRDGASRWAFGTSPVYNLLHLPAFSTSRHPTRALARSLIPPLHSSDVKPKE